MAERSWPRRLWYDFLHVAARAMATPLFQLRVEGRAQFPKTGAVLLLANHQSHYDPVLFGLASDRRLNYVARRDLFDFAPFRWLIQSLDAIPIDRDGLGLDGLKETLRRLKRGEVVLLFPEGTRSRDGRLGELKPGFAALVRRGTVTIMPAAVGGASRAWPRGRAWPGLARIGVVFGEPLSPEQIQQFDERTIVDEVRRRIAGCLARAEFLCGRASPDSAADEPSASEAGR